MRYEVEIIEDAKGIVYLTFENHIPDKEEIIEEAMQAYEIGNVVWDYSDATIAKIKEIKEN